MFGPGPRSSRVLLAALLLLLTLPVSGAIAADPAGNESAPNAAALDADTNCVRACPISETARLIIRRESYTLANNAETKFADWVAYEVDPAAIGPSEKRVWRADPMIPADETLEPQDYKGAHKALHTDRGHQAPLASFTGGDDWKSTNFLSNITPQKSALNQGAWMYLESAVRDLAKARAGIVHVITGPLYERTMPPLPGADEPHRVPSGYWKIVILSGASGGEEAAGFVFDQETPRKADFCNPAYAVAIAEISRRAHVAFDQQISADPPEDLRRRLGCAGKPRKPALSG